MQIMLHVPLVVDQVLYAYNKKKAGNIPKNVLNCWVNLLGFFFPFIWHFPVVGHFCICYRSTADSTGFQLTVKITTLAGQTIAVVLKAHPVLPARAWLMKEHFPQGVCTLWLLKAPSHPSLPSQPWLNEGFFPWWPRLEAACAAVMISWFSLVLSARSLGVCSFPNCCDMLTLKDLYLLCQSKTWRKIHFYSFYLGALSFFFFFPLWKPCNKQII